MPFLRVQTHLVKFQGFVKAMCSGRNHILSALMFSLQVSDRPNSGLQLRLTAA